MSDLGWLRFEVRGLPPAKDGSKSILGPNHRHSQRVLELLRAADAALRGSEGTGFGSALLRLDVEVHAIPELEPWDATNYLGGIADVLESKDRRLMNPQGLTFEHYGALIAVALYDDDRQIKEITYREFPSEEARYIVTVSRL